MFTVYKKEFDLGGRTMTIETGKIARQADGAVTVTYGDTVVMATACFAKSPKPGLDFFPLTVNYQEKFYAAGRIPGGFFRREGRPTEVETLTSRLIDRPIRPLFPKEFKNETQVVVTVLSSDGVNGTESPAMIAASAALTLSGAPFMGPIGGVRVGYVDGEYIINPTPEQQEQSNMELSVAATQEGVLMVESQAKELSEEMMLGAVETGHNACKTVIDAIIELAEVAAKEPYELPEQADLSSIADEIKSEFGASIIEAYGFKEKKDRRAKLDDIKAAVKAKHITEDTDEGTAVRIAGMIKDLEADVLRGDVLEKKVRIDGRGTTDIRPIVSEVDILPRTHGSALFTRGETQAIVVATLGTGRDEQMIDAMDGEYHDRFMLHYNFPPFCVGEVGRMGGTSRRETGHGKLARRAIEPMMPSKEDFNYTVRVVSEITESNGSSSMATVCGTSLSLMAAGVPMERPVAGIAMGLVKEDEKYVVLSDILGDEDHLGDMDFKVAGTEKGITALQMDIKITSITKDIMEIALDQAKDGRLHILGKMEKALTGSRTEVNEHAPALESFKIDKEKIREVIGTGGKVIRELIERTGCAIDVSDDGMVTVSSPNRTSLKGCVEEIKDIVAVPEAGVDYTGEITRIADFGAFVRVLPKVEALLHISEIANVRLGSVEDVLKEGQTITVKCLSVEDNGKCRLSMKGMEQADADVTAKLEEVEAAGGTSRPEGDRPKRDDRRGGRDDKRRPRRA
jgi:polyribonucleotide nucleotidyltransferase